jgi:hypothetical protein
MEPMTTYYVVRDDAGDPRILFRGDGAFERYNGAGGWVPDGHLMKYFGLGGDAEDADVIQAADLADATAAIDRRYAAAAARNRAG